MDAQVAKWGNSYALRIPVAIAKSLNVKVGSKVDLAIDDGVLVVRPVTDRSRIALDDLLAGMTPQNVHPETATGPAVGYES
jgi:antitoxin MazE